MIQLIIKWAPCASDIFFKKKETSPKGLDSSNKYVTLKMTDVPSKHVWKIKESCYVYTTKETSIVKFLPTANLFSAAGFSLWSWWSACSKTCRSSGVAGTQERTRICINRILGCEAHFRQTRTCNPEACQGKEDPYGVTWRKTRGRVFLLIVQNKKIKENGT